MSLENYKYSYIKYISPAKYQLFIFGGVILSFLIILSAVTLASGRISWFGRAQTVSLVPTAISKENSYVFASPVSAIADGVSIIRVTVFILNNQGLGVSGQKVRLQSSGAITIRETVPVTDEFGRATFDLTSSAPGDCRISADISGLALPQTVSVSFH